MNELKNYNKETLTIDLVWANVFGLLILIPILLIFALPYYFMWMDKLTLSNIKTFITNFTFQSYALLLFKATIAFISGIVLHELIHGIAWAICAKNGIKSIKFGVMWKMLTPYCHCKEPLRVKHYILGALMPGIVLGIIPAIISIIIGNIYLLFFGVFFTMAACGDFLVIHLLRKEKRNDWVQDHPSEAGCFIYRNPISE